MIFKQSNVKRRHLAAALLMSVGSVSLAFAQEVDSQGDADHIARLDVITVTGWTLRELDKQAETGSRLGLTVKETPATIDQIGASEILTRGFRTVEEATVSLPGVTSGGSPGQPALFNLRGFDGSQITILKNGLYVGPGNMINRPGNTFNIESVDLLKGPASVLYGQGAIGGAVNIVSKSPDLDKDSLQVLASYGTFDTVSGGIGGNKVLSDELALRMDASYHRTEGFIKNAPSDSFNATAALLYQPSTSFSAELSIDYLRDNLTPYYGTPLVSRSFASNPMDDIITSEDGRVVDEALSDISYNVSDSKAHSWQIWPRLVLDWEIAENLSLSSTTYYFHAEREWVNAESYAFNDSTGKIDRDRFFVFHDQDIYGTQASLKYHHHLGGLENTLVVGAEYSHLDFVRDRGFPDGDSVDPFYPDPGLFGPIDKRTSPTQWDQFAIFAEDVLEITDKLKLVTGIRVEQLDLNRENYNVDGSFNEGQSFSDTYDNFNLRAGIVYDLTEKVSVYGSYSTGKDPVGSNIFLVNANQNFEFSDASQAEMGLKADLGKGSITVSIYDIERENILSVIGADELSNVGSQKSQGVEVSGEYKPTSNWSLIGSAAYTDAEYGDYTDPNFGVDATGNTPANVPEWVANFWTSFQNVGGLPLEIGGGLKYVSDRQANSANTVTLAEYTTGILYGTYEISPGLSLTVRANNVFDEDYVQWADIFYPNQVQLGEPRRLEVSILARF